MNLFEILIKKLMRTYKKYLIGLFINVGFGVWLFYGHPSILENQEQEIEVGKTYIFSFDWDSEDPFKEIEIDTVKVIGIKGDYVQWEYKNGIRLSGKLKHFKHFGKPFN